MKLQRIQKIEEYIKQHGSLSLDELCREFEVSKNTIRRDIQELEARQIVNKVYGGVTFNAKDALIPLAQRQITLKAEKMRIAAKAAELAQDGDILVIDAGSTTAHTVDYLSRRKHLTVITNSVPVLNAALRHDFFHVIVTGGDLLRPTYSLVGPEAVAALKKLHANTVFLAATSVSLTHGLTNSSTMEVELKKTMMDVSQQVVLLVDHTKLETVSLVTFAALKDVDVLVTDHTPPPEYFEYGAQHGVEIVVAEA